MTPTEMKEASTATLVTNYKKMAKDLGTRRLAQAIWMELLLHIGADSLREIRNAHFEMQQGKGNLNFDEACDKFIESIV